MAGLAQLKKRLRGVELSGQLAGAMKTVASAKFAKLNKRYAAYRRYAEELELLLRQCGGELTPALPQAPEARSCYLVLGYSRGFCGGYNAELHAFADRVLGKDPGAMLFVSGKAAVAHFTEKKQEMQGQFFLPDIPDTADCHEMLEAVLAPYLSGQVNTVHILRQKYVNTLTQMPEDFQLLPIARQEETDTPAEWLLLPDRDTVLAGLWRRAVEGELYGAVLETAIGAQASTLTAMRTASDNAAQTAEKLENEINKKRQSAVTSGVIETASGALFDEEEEHGDRR